MTNLDIKILFISSPGGHFVELLEIIASLNPDNFAVVVSGISTYDKGDMRILCAPQADRNLAVFRQFYFAFICLIKERPRVIISTGAGIAVPFFIYSRILRINTIYIETPTAIYKPTLTCRIVRWFSDRLYVRTEMLQTKIKNSIYLS